MMNFQVIRRPSANEKLDSCFLKRLRDCIGSLSFGQPPFQTAPVWTVLFEEVTILQPDQHLSEVGEGVVMLTEGGLFHIYWCTRCLGGGGQICFGFAKTIASILSLGLD